MSLTEAICLKRSGWVQEKSQSAYPQDVVIESNVEARKESKVIARLSSFVTAYMGVPLSVLFTEFKNEERRIRLQIDSDVITHLISIPILCSLIPAFQLSTFTCMMHNYWDYWNANSPPNSKCYLCIILASVSPILFFLSCSFRYYKLSRQNLHGLGLVYWIFGVPPRSPTSRLRHLLLQLHVQCLVQAGVRSPSLWLWFEIQCGSKEPY